MVTCYGVDVGTGSTSSGVWYTWTTATTSTVTTDVTWSSWAGTGTSVTFENASTTGAWISWSSDTGVITTHSQEEVYIYGNWAAKVTETQEQKAARLEREREAERLAKLEQEKRAAAKKRAEALVLETLPQKAKKLWSKRRTFFVRGKKGYYEIGPRNIIYLVNEHGEALESWCCHPPNQYEEGDRVVATMLELLADEDGVIRKGNKQANILPSERRRLKEYFSEQMAA